jgi:site-specific recombinase XerD
MNHVTAVETQAEAGGGEVVAIPDLGMLPSGESCPPDRHPVAVYLARLDANSRRTMRGALAIAATHLTGGRLTAERLPWASLDYQHLVALRSWLAGRYAPSTGNRILTAVRGVLRECRRLGYMTHEQQIRAGDVPPIKGARLPKGRMLMPDELRKLFQVCAEDAGPIGRRDAALLAVLYGAGLRRMEAVSLDVRNYDLVTGALVVRAGKGKKDRQLFVGNGSAGALGDWLSIRGGSPGALFVPINKSGRLRLDHRLTDKAITLILEKRAMAAGVRGFSPHDLRRSFISGLLDAGVDLVTVSAMAGHANIATTAKYDRRGEEAKRQAAARLTVPFVRMRQVS